MKPFRYLLDPLCLSACLAYLLNRVFLASSFPAPFLTGSFNDLLLIPAALPPVLWLQRRARLRLHDRVPDWGEIFAHWAIWSLICEGLAPLFLPRAVGDIGDVLAYGAGALLAGTWWHRHGIPALLRHPRAGFDRMASLYDGLENLLAGRKLESCREAFLENIPPPAHILLVGEGHGRFLVKIRRAFPDASITCIDSSSRMLAVARRRLQRAGLSSNSVTFVPRDLRQWQAPDQSFDLIVTQFFLDCFPPPQLKETIRHLATSARPGTLWWLSDFQLPDSGYWRRARAAAILWLMYRFFRIVTRLPAVRLTPPGPILEGLGFYRQDRKEYEWGLLYSELWQAPAQEKSSPPADFPVTSRHEKYPL